MKWIAALFIALQLLVSPSAAMAQDAAAGGYAYRTVSTTSWVEEWDEAQQRWVRVAGDAEAATKDVRAVAPAATTTITRESPTAQITTRTYQATRYALPRSTPGTPGARDTAAGARAVAQYGPFVVLGAERAAVIGSTDSASPHHFDAMLRDFPGLRVLEMVEAPGTSNDIANLAVGRRIRAAGLDTYVPRGGSVRSGAVELFLAGKQRRVDQGAQFAVHSWLDNYGRQPADFAADAPENRLYLDYYVEMGMSESRARAFYSMTNSVPHSGAKWLDAGDMLGWITPERPLQRQNQRSAARRMAAAQPRYQAQADWVIAAMQDTPIALPPLALSHLAIETIPAIAMSLPVSVPVFGPAATPPSIGYGDVAALTLANSAPAPATAPATLARAKAEIGTARHYAFLDS